MLYERYIRNEVISKQPIPRINNHTTQAAPLILKPNFDILHLEQKGHNLNLLEFLEINKLKIISY